MKPNDPVQLKIPGSCTWSRGVCKKQVATRFYVVECNGNLYRRNRRHLRQANVNQEHVLNWESDSDEGEEREESTEEREESTETLEPANATEVNTARCVPSGRVSTFGRVIKPTQRYIEQADT